MLLFTNAATAQAHTKTVTIDDNLLSLSGGEVLAAPNFNSSLGSLTDVSLILKLDGQSYTLFDANNPGDSLISLFAAPYPAGNQFSGGQLAAWGKSGDFVDLDCTLPEGKTASEEGPAAIFLFNTPFSQTSRCLQIDYTCNIGSPTSTPEPAAKYLAAIAASAMAWLLWRRKPRADLLTGASQPLA